MHNLWIEPTDKSLFSNPELRTTAYSNSIKKIGIELEVGTKINISPELLDWMQKDA